MKRFFSTLGGKITLTVLIIVLIAGVAGGVFCYWLFMQPKFHDVTIELGEALPDTQEFLNEQAVSQWASLATPVSKIDLTKAGQQQLTFVHGGVEETVTLTIVDTIAPVVTFRDVTTYVGQTVLPEDFVEEITDLSGCTVEFAQELTQPDSYGKMPVTVVVTDEGGNVTEGTCSISFVWMRSAFEMELGGTVTKEDLLLDPEKDGELLNQAILDQINASGAGSYTVTSTDGSVTCQCVITVSDTVAPELVLKDLQAYAHLGITAADFVELVEDFSGDVTLTFAVEPDLTVAGAQTVTIIATDPSGNTATGTAVLELLLDTTGPVFSGVGNLSVVKGSTPNFSNGVSATDDVDGLVTFTVDSSKVDMSTAGTYYVTYTATDAAGNTTTYRRKITVENDGNDTAALVKSIAAKLSDDPEAIRDYVRKSISYNHNWGGEDPVWYGFSKKVGNCYVHALCLQVLLSEKGYTTQLIWVDGSEPGSDKAANGWDPHYWLIIYLDGTWWHIDATPGRMHSKYSLMNDEMRYETLSGRDWDRSMWPACDGETP